jgi:tRNA(His) 5'-end guanylyltransferase
MEYAAVALCERFSGVVIAYIQSDEMSFLAVDYQTINTEPWYGNRTNKIESVSASIVTANFNKKAKEILPEQSGKKGFLYFDSRAWNVPQDDVNNYFIFRQNDCTRNSIQSLGQANFSHKELQGKSCSDIQDMLMLQKDINWNDVETRYKRGTAIYKKGNERGEWFVDHEMPILTQDRSYIEKWVYFEDKSKPKESES